ncbi:MAG: response regulator [Granulosicoccus sp.]|nr:response regulator [Granulosicoccus sp.]
MPAESISAPAQSIPELQSRREQDTRIAMFLLLCGNLPWIILGSFTAGLALFIVLQDQIPLSVRLPWFTLVVVLTLGRIFLLRHWKLHATTGDNVDRRILIATLTAFIMAVSFGTLAFLAVSEDDPLMSLLVVMVLTGMVASATASISHLLPMYLLYIFPVMVPVALRLAGLEQSGYHWLAGLILIYLIVCLGTSRSIRASIMHSINVRYENLNLLENLRQEKQRAEVALKREEQANHAKSKFLAAASHDLRQPLHSLRLFTATLALQMHDTEHKTLVSQIDTSVKSLEELFNALLDISKLDAGTFTVDKQHVYLDSLLWQIEGEFKPLAHEKQLYLHVELTDHVIYTDALLLERLIRNLASNAIRYTSSGGVSLNTRVDQQRVWISIADTGVGIPVSEQARVFEEFVQLGNIERDRNQGIGLGLSIVKRLSVLLDVQVDVQSQPGQGTTFTIGVPLGDAMQCRYSPNLTAGMEDQLDSLFVLVIDDEEEVCLAVEGLLETWGCIVMTATSGDAAVQQLDEIGELPDVLLSDYRLRDGETGGEVIQRIRTTVDRDIPAIILTGDIAPDRLKEIQALGFPMLHKPCEPEVLRQLLSSATRSGADTHGQSVDDADIADRMSTDTALLSEVRTGNSR